MSDFFVLVTSTKPVFQNSKEILSVPYCCLAGGDKKKP